jgi:hypothetical protein
MIFTFVSPDLVDADQISEAEPEKTAVGTVLFKFEGHSALHLRFEIDQHHFSFLGKFESHHSSSQNGEEAVHPVEASHRNIMPHHGAICM